ncbi:MAG: cytochrome c oxidase assembly protein CtaG/Cox11 [Hyphomicrobiales bacterium]|nr:cytochrome c oxidase assembly protein CtaG/Cox11 [Hyphomicrobiales bacterium]
MSEPPSPSSAKARRRGDLRVAAAVTFAAFGMLGMSFAAVPLYQMFCQATGFGGTPRINAVASGVRGERTMTVRFDANVGPGLDWSFEPEIAQMRLRTGETATVFYKVTNRSSHESVGMATYNVAPDAFGPWFNKISCFCFTEQTLGPGESMDMPVVFFLDPELEKSETMRNMQSVTLSYTFIAVKKKPPVTAAAQDLKPRL